MFRLNWFVTIGLSVIIYWVNLNNNQVPPASGTMVFLLGLQERDSWHNHYPPSS